MRGSNGGAAEARAGTGGRDERSGTRGGVRTVRRVSDTAGGSEAARREPTDLRLGLAGGRLAGFEAVNGPRLLRVLSDSSSSSSSTVVMLSGPLLGAGGWMLSEISSGSRSSSTCSGRTSSTSTPGEPSSSSATYRPLGGTASNDGSAGCGGKWEGP